MYEHRWKNELKCKGTCETVSTKDRTEEEFESGAFHHETHRFIKSTWHGKQREPIN